MLKIRVLKEQQLSDAEKITIDSIIDDKSVISFDFDNTLVKSFPDFDDEGELIYVNGGSNSAMIRLMSDLIDDPSKKVYLVTSRNQKADERVPETSIETMLNKLNLSPDGFFYTNGERKVTKLKELGVQIHFDDDVKEHDAIKGSDIQVFYPDDFLEDTMNVSKVIAVTLDNKILLLKRADTGEFDIPGGHGKDGETAEYTVIRETKEETGLELFNLKEISTKKVEFQGRLENITYFFGKLNDTSDDLRAEIKLDTSENTEYFLVEPQFIDEYMGNATQNLKNVGNSIKSLTVDEQMEPFQKKMASGYSEKKKVMIGQGKNKYKSAPFNKDPSFKRAKSAPPGFGGSLEELLTEIEFDLSRLVMRDELCPNFWKDEKLNKDIRKKLLEIARDFAEGTPIEDRIDDITLTGSMAGYNYYDGSDVDLHILVDFQDDDEVIKDLMNALRINWNNSHDIFIFGHEVEIYVQDSNEKHYSSGVFSLLDNKWLQKPSKEDVKIDTAAVVKKAQGLSDEIDAIGDDFREQNYQESYDSVQRLRKKLKNMRSAGLEDEGIYSIENLAFKLLRNSGQIGKLMSLGSDSYDNLMGYGEKGKIKINITKNIDEKKKKRRKKRKKPRFHGVYYPYGGLQDSVPSPAGGNDGDGGGE